LNAEQPNKLEDDLWTSADTLRANSGLKSSEYATPILGLIFLKFADNKYSKYEAEIHALYEASQQTRAPREIAEIAIDKCGFYLPDNARYASLLNLPESADIALALKTAMETIEQHVTSLKDTLPTDEYFEIGKNSGVLKRLLQNFSNIPADAEGDLFGQIYEYFLGKFALAEGQGGGEFFTPRSVVRLMVEMIEPHRGRVFDPACGSGGMFVQSARFIEERRKHGSNDADVTDLFVCGQEKTLETVKLAKMNLAVNGLRGEIKQGNSYSLDVFESFENFDYVLANPPFNVDEVEIETVAHDKRFSTYGIPRNKTKPSGKNKDAAETVPNANYLWIGLFATSLKPKGRAALVMANSASDAQQSEAEIRRKLIEANLIYGMVALPSNLFYTVTLPATLWFFERDKTDDRILFLDTRRVFTQIDRAHREFSEDQLQNLAIISHLHRGESHRFHERIEDCITQGKERIEAVRAEFPCVQNLLKEALAQFSGVLKMGDAQENALAHAADSVQKAAEVLTVLLTSPPTPLLAIRSSLGEGSLATGDCSPLSAIIKAEHEEGESQLDSPLSSERSEGIRRGAGGEVNAEQQAIVTEGKTFVGSVQAAVNALDKALRDYEKALGEEAKAEGKRKPQDKKLRDAKAALDTYAASVKFAAESFANAAWLQERFPEGEYTDVVGLCKRATKEEVAEQDWSLNPGRYVGVVIEEDGKTPEEFRADLQTLNAELERLNARAAELASVISHNVAQIVGA